ncbi:MAG TPA: D-glycerate dehydrogenase [Thermomicrobiales bacterium]|nr:D-glycerate dehydrogenase [Thermomicrobiales bacterium]
MLVAVTRRIDLGALAQLESIAELRYWDNDLPPSPEELRDLLAGVDGALTLLTDRIDGGLLDELPNLKVVSNLAVGFDNIDVAACTARGVAACTTPNVLTQTTAEFALALIFAVARQMVPGARAAREGEWKTWYPFRFLGRDLAGATLGVVGLGRIGRRLSEMAAAIGMRVIYTDEYSDVPEFRRVSLEDLYRTADVISLHVPLTPETHGMIGADALAMMKPDALLINTARGPVIDTEALVAALNDGLLGGVGLDVTDPEPLPPDHALYGFDRVTIVPHIASATSVTRHKMSSLAAENIIAVLTGGEPPNCLNPEVLRRG